MLTKHQLCYPKAASWRPQRKPKDNGRGSQEHKQKSIAEALKLQAQIGTRDVKASVINHCLMYDQVINY